MSISIDKIMSLKSYDDIEVEAATNDFDPREKRSDTEVTWDESVLALGSGCEEVRNYGRKELSLWGMLDSV
jgi:hypothetical protein